LFGKSGKLYSSGLALLPSLPRIFAIALLAATIAAEAAAAEFPITFTRSIVSYGSGDYPLPDSKGLA
jgi:hypothetical protein